MNKQLSELQSGTCKSIGMVTDEIRKIYSVCKIEKLIEANKILESVICDIDKMSEEEENN